jgi:hypothetical protein
MACDRRLEAAGRSKGVIKLIVNSRRTLVGLELPLTDHPSGTYCFISRDLLNTRNGG